VTKANLISPQEALEKGLVDELAADAQQAEEKAKKGLKELLECDPWGRHQSKMSIRSGPGQGYLAKLPLFRFRKDLIDRFYEHRQQDLDWHVETLTSDAVKNKIGVYLESMKKK